MKKSKLITCLSAAFVSAMALMSCSSLINGKDGVILTIDGVEYRAQDLFEDQKTPAAAEAKFNAVYKVAVRAYFTKDPGLSEMPEIKRNTEIKINEQKATAQSNADKNGTSYAEEWQKILDSNGVEDETGLYNKFEYELQKEKYENNFYDKHYKELRQGNKFPDLPEKEEYKFESYIEGKQPYHIKHILVKLSNAKAGDSTSAEITPQEARNLSGVIQALARGDSFESVSTNFNEDETARKSGGSLGIMSRDTSFVNDFKLGVYMYEAFHGTSTTKDASGDYGEKNAKKELFIEGSKAEEYAETISTLEDPTTVATDGTTNIGIGQIPFGVAVKLGDYADYDLENNKTIKEKFERVGLYKDDIAAKYLPRNVLFNKYFNKHNIMVITAHDDHDYTATNETFGKYYNTTGAFKRDPAVSEPYHGKYNSAYVSDSYKGFNRESIAKNGDLFNHDLYGEDASGKIVADADANKAFLRDENGRIILVFRSGTGDSSSNDAYQGIHFVVIERSPFIGKEFDSADQKSKETSLDDYYTHIYPGQKGTSEKHPTYSDTPDATDWKKTFINYTNELPDEKTLKDRADIVKSELKKCDPKLDTYLYQNLLVTGGIKFTNEAASLNIEKSIADWIKMSRATNKLDTQKTWDDTWEEYCFSLENQIEQREVHDDMTGKLVPEMCVESFVHDTTFNYDDTTPTAQLITLDKLFGKGGVFHE